MTSSRTDRSALVRSAARSPGFFRRATAVGLAVVSCSLFAACSEDDPAPAAAPVSQAPSLAGTFTSVCANIPQADGSTQHLKLDFDLSATRWKLDYQLFSDEACSARFLTVHIEGPYSVGAASSVVPGAYDGTFGFDVRTVTPHDDAATGFVSSLGCGTGGFTKGSATDTLVAACAGLGQHPVAECAQDYDLVKLEGDSLRFGKRPADNDMCAESKRPTELSPLAVTRVR